MAKSETRRTAAAEIFYKSLKPMLTGLLFLAGVTNANTPGSSSFEAASEEAKQLIAQVDKLNYDGRYIEATPLAERAAAIRERIFGKEHIETAAALDTLCFTYRQAGRYREAKVAIERALPIRERVLGPSHPETARSLNNLGALRNLFGDYTEAETLYRRSLEIRERVLGPDHLDTTISMGNLGNLYFIQGHQEKGERLLQQALAIRERTLGESAETADMLGRLASTLMETNNLSEAQVLYSRSASLFQKTLRPNHPQLAASLANLGHIEYRLGAYRRAEELLLRALAIRESALLPNNLQTSGTLNYLGMLYARIGEYAKAELYFKRSVFITGSLRAAGASEPGAAINNLGELYVSMGRYEEARELLEQSLAAKLKTLGPLHPRVAVSLHALGTVYRLQGDLDRSELAFRQALDIQDKSLGRFNLFNAQTLVSIAALKWQQGNTEQAINYFERAYEIHSRSSASLLRGLSESRNQEYVRTLTDDTHRFVSFSVAHPTPAGILLGLDATLAYKARALDSRSSGSDTLKVGLDSSETHLHNKQAQIASELSKLAYLPPRRLSMSASYRKRIESLEQEQDAVDEELTSRNSSFRFRVNQVAGAQLREALPPKTALIEWIRFSPFSPATLGVNGRQLSRPEPPRYAAFIVTRDRQTIALDIGNANSVDSAIGRFRKSLSNPSLQNQSAEAEISEMLFSPLEEHLGGIEHLVISPDGVLSLVPFVALRDKNGTVLNRKFEISYLTSGRELLKKPIFQRPNRHALVVANPNFGDIQSATSASPSPTTIERSFDFDRVGFVFRPLDHSEREAQDLARLLGPASSVLTGASATEAAIKRTHSPNVLHIASHGFFLSDQEFNAEIRRKSGTIDDLPTLENPLLRSGLALAGANERKSGENEDGILTALEVAQLDLNGTELVVLSACDSGLGEIKNGEGVYGLRRALVLAGAQTQVTSLWKVSDEATRILMVSFYKKLLAGEGRSEALRHAQLELMDDPKYSHPYYWASFIPIGDWTPLKSIQKNQSVAKAH